MFKKLFKKNTNEEKNYGIPRTEIKRAEIKRIEIPKTDPEMITIKYTRLDTGETIEFSYDDDEAFDKMMTCNSAIELFN